MYVYMCDNFHVWNFFVLSFSTNMQIIPFFEVCLKLPNQNAGAALAGGSTKVTTPVLVAYIAGVLATFTKVRFHILFSMRLI